PRAQAGAIRRNLSLPELVRSLLQSGTRGFADAQTASRISRHTRPRPRRRRSIEQVTGSRTPAILVARNWLCGCRLPLEMARTGIASGNEAHVTDVRHFYNVPILLICHPERSEGPAFFSQSNQQASAFPTRNAESSLALSSRANVVAPASRRRHFCLSRP